MRAPRTTMESAVSPTLCSGTLLPANDESLARSMVGWTMVCVSEMSSRASCFWNASRLATPASLRPSGPRHALGSPANPA